MHRMDTTGLAAHATERMRDDGPPSNNQPTDGVMSLKLGVPVGPLVTHEPRTGMVFVCLFVCFVVSVVASLVR